MGQNITLRCTSCKNAISLSVGQGLNDNRLDRVLTYFTDNNREIIKNELNKHGGNVNWSFSRMIASCRINHNLRSLPTFHISDETDRIIVAQCDCGGEHDIFDPEGLELGTVKINCPKCGQQMRYIRNGFWD
ncbi:MAG: hypothetical protein J5509_09125 [Lachnospiraceae bacterium]|nr:hypothetical protein [Lachnospiraceae bacterium]